MSPKKILGGTLLTLFFSSCLNQPEIPVEPVIQFSTQIQPIMASNCATSGCHEGRSQFSLETYRDIRSRVKPGDARGSSLYTAMTTLWGETAMPPDGPLSDQQLNLIYTWIMQGAKDN